MRTILWIMALCVACGCATDPGTRRGEGYRIGSKMVAGKEAPATLYAEDGSHCLVTPGRFERVRIGDRVWCNWEVRGARIGSPFPEPRR